MYRTHVGSHKCALNGLCDRRARWDKKAGHWSTDQPELAPVWDYMPSVGSLHPHNGTGNRMTASRFLFGEILGVTESRLSGARSVSS